MVAGLIFFLSPRGHPAPTSRPLPNFVAINLGGGRQALPSVPHLRVRNVGTRGLADARVVLIPNTVFWRLSSGIVQRLRKAVRGGTVVVVWQDTRQTVDGGLVERALQVPGAPSVTDARLDAFASSNVYAGGVVRLVNGTWSSMTWSGSGPLSSRSRQELDLEGLYPDLYKIEVGRPF